MEEKDSGCVTSIFEAGMWSKKSDAYHIVFFIIHYIKSRKLGTFLYNNGAVILWPAFTRVNFEFVELGGWKQFCK